MNMNYFNSFYIIIITNCNRKKRHFRIQTKNILIIESNFTILNFNKNECTLFFWRESLGRALSYWYTNKDLPTVKNIEKQNTNLKLNFTVVYTIRYYVSTYTIYYSCILFNIHSSICTLTSTNSSLAGCSDLSESRKTIFFFFKTVTGICFNLSVCVLLRTFFIEIINVKIPNDKKCPFYLKLKLNFLDKLNFLKYKFGYLKINSQGIKVSTK